MIKFTYKKEIEDMVLNEYILPNKNKLVSDMISKELESVKIDISNTIIKEQIECIKNHWLSVKDKFLKELGDFYEKKLPEPELICYLTRLDIFPYSYGKEEGENWFSAPLFTNPAERNRVIMHELVHYYQPTELPKEIKEAIPEILNDHEKFCMYSFERGHKEEKEQEWRKTIWELYQKGGKYSDLIKLVK